MNIPFFRSPWQAGPGAEALTRAWSGVLADGQYILGPQVARFEAALGACLGGQAVAGVNSGTDALVLALQVLDLSPGDEVVLPSYTFFACLEAVWRVGAVPVLCDARPDDFLAGDAEIAACVTSRTRAVLAVPLFGDASALPGIAALCRERGLMLVEDAAQALGARVPQPGGSEALAGTLGDLSTFSFYPTKTLGAVGDAGALTSRHGALLARARILRNHGVDAGLHHHLGLNSRMDELQAVVLQAGLLALPGWLAQRQAIAQRYLAGLADAPGVTPPRDTPGHAWNYFVLRHPQRDTLRQRLAEHGIASKVYYDRALHAQPAYLARGAPVRLPHAESHAGRALALPLYPGLTEAEVARVIDAVREACQRCAA
ncbi:DegT/DnrJ/EryC1/StrS family aminotransferase [Hydrogenophaga sp. OTU3427]|uniref:DegT/DnrJ/EryC1/StrS family aminotransferase n=1 Tax=Hydrogenophaga sp. OTU3427 TaxID=3043856 RepID=UPI00313DE8CE